MSKDIPTLTRDIRAIFLARRGMCATLPDLDARRATIQGYIEELENAADELRELAEDAQETLDRGDWDHGPDADGALAAPRTFEVSRRCADALRERAPDVVDQPVKMLGHQFTAVGWNDIAKSRPLLVRREDNGRIYLAPGAMLAEIRERIRTKPPEPRTRPQS